MPISHLVKYGLLSSAIFLSSTVAVQAQSDLPGCADQVVKDIVLDIISENIERERKGLPALVQLELELDWQIETFALAYITLQSRNEITGKLVCHASLQGQRDRAIYNKISESVQPFLFLEGRGYWDRHNITAMEYHISQSAEDPEYFVVSVIY